MRFAALLTASVLAVDPTGWDRYGPLRFALISAIGFLAIAISYGAGDQRPQPLPRWAVLGWTILVASMTISTILATDRWTALIGTPERHFGLITWLLLAGLFAASSMYPNSIVGPIRRAAMWSTAIAGLWAILEKLDVGWFDSAFAGDRVGGPFGQPAFLGAAMVLLIPVCASRAFDPVAGRAARVLGGSSGLLGLVALGLSESRAAWVGFVLAVVILIVQRRQVVPGLVFAAFLAVVAIATPIGDRAATLADVDSGVVAGRLDEWRVGSRALTDTVTFGVTGHGPEGYRTVFGRHVDDQYVIDYGRDVITDRAHNGILDVALTGGFAASVGLLLLQLGLGVTAIQRMRADDTFDRALSVGVLAYGVQQLFLFPLAELDPILWIFAGLLIARRPRRTTYPPPLFREVSGSKRVIMAAAGILAAVAAIAGLSDVAADHAVKSALDATQADDALDHADAARQRRPDSIRYDFIAARIATEPGTPEAFISSLERLDEGLRLSPNDPAFLAERSSVLLELARRTSDTGDLARALEAFDALDVSDPRNPQVQSDYGIALALDGQLDAAIEKLNRAILLNPDAIEPLLNRAIIELEAGRLDEGRETLSILDALAPSNATVESLRREFLSE